MNAHVAVKSIYVHIFRGTPVMHARSWVVRVVWAFICIVLWTFSWIIVEAIPVFNEVVGLAVRIH